MDKRIVKLQKQIAALEEDHNRIYKELAKLERDLKEMRRICKHKYDLLYENDGFGISGIAPDARDRYYKCNKCGHRTRRILNPKKKQ